MLPLERLQAAQQLIAGTLLSCLGCWAGRHTGNHCDAGRAMLRAHVSGQNEVNASRSEPAHRPVKDAPGAWRIEPLADGYAKARP